MLSCICLDLYEIDEPEKLNSSECYTSAGHLFLFSSESRLSHFLQQNSMKRDESLIHLVLLFQSLSLGEHFTDYGFMTKCGNYALYTEEVSIFHMKSGHTDDVEMFLQQFDEHKVAAVNLPPVQYVCSRNDEELIRRTAEAYRLVIAFISYN
ncbi:hypothetical protein ACFQPF_01805 [Fictibacillus iocasae]|uniref:Uncharacterized protein n=1 Tax=Fictibacillus iocasae TaxID=2715437 RepID=A0ABW2NKR9_9BACL